MGLKIHAVFDRDLESIINVLKRYGEVVWDYSIDSACLWAKNKKDEDPDIVLINGGSTFSNIKDEQRISKNKAFINNLFIIRKHRSESRIILLLPENKEKDIDFIEDILKLNIYDFYFVDEFDEDDLKSFILNKKELGDVEKYFRTKERVEEFTGEHETEKDDWGKVEFKEIPIEGQKPIKSKGKVDKIYKPYVVKSNIIVFWSPECSLISHGTALFTALSLAKNGFSVALVEPILDIPKLARSTGLIHPYYNTSHAVSMYGDGIIDFMKNCLINSEAYLKDKNSINTAAEYIEEFPPNLYILPDLKKEDNLPKERLQELWKSFIMEFAKIVVFEKKFDFLIFDCHGDNQFVRTVINDVAYLKFLTISLQPTSIEFGLKEYIKDNYNTHLIGSKFFDYIAQDIEEPIIYPPDSLEEDILNYIYLKKHETTEETHYFIEKIVEKIGVKLPESSNQRERLGDRLFQLTKNIKFW